MTILRSTGLTGRFLELVSDAGVLLLAGLCVYIAGCAVTPKSPATVPPTEPVLEKPQVQQSEIEAKQALIKEQDRQIAQLEARVQELEGQIRKLNSGFEAEVAARQSLAKRLEAAQTAREDAIREVVRMRARIQGMASHAEATAMFAEARVLLDRMEEEAFSSQALEDLFLARSYMARGKGALDKGNPGGAAYLFDLIPGLYEGMKKTDPRLIKINVSVAALREKPASSSRKIASLFWGETVTGVLKNRGWVKVLTKGGQTGWIMGHQTQ